MPLTYEFDWLNDYDGTLAGFNAILDAMEALTAMSPQAPSRLIARAGQYDFGNGYCGTRTLKNFKIDCEGDATEIVITSVGPQGGRVMELVNCVDGTFSGFQPRYMPNLVGLSRSVFAWDGGADVGFEYCWAPNGPQLFRIGENNGVSRPRIIAPNCEGWRCDISAETGQPGLAWIDIFSASGFIIWHPVLNSQFVGGDAYLRLCPNQADSEDDQFFIDTGCVDFGSFQALGEGTKWAIILDASVNHVVNVEFRGGVNDHGYMGGILARAAPGSTAFMRHIKLVNTRSAPASGPVLEVDWQSSGDLLDFEADNPAFIYGGADPAVLIHPPAFPLVFGGVNLRNGSLTNQVPINGTPPSAVISSGGRFSIQGMTHHSLPTAPMPDYILETTADIPSYDFKNNNCFGVANRTVKHFAYAQPNADRVISGNGGLSEDTVEHDSLSASGIVSGYCPEALKFFSWVSRNGCCIAQARRQEYNIFIEKLIQSGAWDKLPLIYILASFDGEFAALCNLRFPGVNTLTKVQSDPNPWALQSGLGFTFDGVSRYLSTGVTPAQVGIKQDDLSAFIGVTSTIAANADYVCGSGSTMRINPMTAAKVMSTRANAAVDSTGRAVRSSVGGWGIYRNDPAFYTESANGFAVVQNIASSALGNGIITIGAAGVAISRRRVGVAAFGRFIDTQAQAALLAASAGWFRQ